MAVGAHGFAAHCLGVDGGACRFEVGRSAVEVETAGGTVDHRLFAALDLQQRWAGRHDGGQSQRARQNGRVRGRAAAADGQSDDMAHVQLQGVRWRQILRHENARLAQDDGGTFDAQQDSDHAFAGILEVERTRGEQRVGYLALLVDTRIEGLFPCPCRAVTAHDVANGGAQQRGVSEQFALGGKYRGFRCAEATQGFRFHGSEFAFHGVDGCFESGAVLNGGGRCVLNDQGVAFVSCDLADSQSWAGGNTLLYARRGRRFPDRRIGSGLGGGNAGALGVGDFFGGQAGNCLGKIPDRRLGAFATRGENDSLVEGDAQSKQTGKRLGIRCFTVLENAHFAGMATRRFDPLCRRARVQTVRIIDHDFQPGVGRPGFGGSRRRHVGGVGQCGDDTFGVGAGSQFFDGALLLHQAGQPAQDGDVLVGLRGNGHDQARLLALLPLHPGGNLNHSDARVDDVVTVFDHPVRNRNAHAQKCVRYRLAFEQALHVRWGDVSRFDQMLAGKTDCRLLRLYRSLNDYTRFCNRFHLFL